MSLKLSVTVYDRQSMMSNLKELGLEDELFYLGYSQLGRRLDTEFFQTIYPQFDLDRYIEDSEYHVSRYAVKEVLRFFERFTYKDVVFVDFKEI